MLREVLCSVRNRKLIGLDVHSDGLVRVEGAVEFRDFGLQLGIGVCICKRAQEKFIAYLATASRDLLILQHVGE